MSQGAIASAMTLVGGDRAFRGAAMVRTAVVGLTIALILAGCASNERIAYRPLEAAGAQVEGFDKVRIYADAPRDLPDLFEWTPAARTDALDYLALSGGGGGGAFGVGVLTAWSHQGTRPQFDIVSGVSTGALIAPFAFLGPTYDDRLTELYTSGVAKQLVEAKFLPSGLLGSSFLKQTPLRAMVEKHLTQEVLLAVAAEHRNGRRLLVLTSNLDSQRAVIWNMGAIANSGRPEALALFRNVLIASASIPGVYPAVLIKVSSGGRTFEEMHSDGGSASQVLTIPEGWMAEPEEAPWPKEMKYNMYILINNKLMGQFSSADNRTIPVMGRAYSMLVKAQTRSTLLAAYAYALRHGIGFHVASIDQDAAAASLTDPFNTVYMRSLYDLGYAEMKSGALWKERPIFTEPSPLEREAR